MIVRDDQVYLAHIIDALTQISTYTEGMDSTAFLGNRMVQDAVIRQFEVIGEATKNLSEPLKEKYPLMLWKDLAGFRDKLIHQYFGVDLTIVWRSIVEDVPSLMDEFGKIRSTVSSPLK